jgi:S1-C subfamily serine protease
MLDGKPNGMKVYAIKPRSWLAQLGLENGDNITSVDGVTLGSLDAVLGLPARLHAAPQVVVTLIRRGQPLTWTVELVGSAPPLVVPKGVSPLAADDDEPGEAIAASGGRMKYDQLTMALVDQERLSCGRVVPALKAGKPFGVKLYAIRDGSWCAVVGLENGDTIVTLDGRTIATSKDLFEIHTAAGRRSTTTFGLVRRGKATSLTLQLE